MKFSYEILSAVFLHGIILSWHSLGDKKTKILFQNTIWLTITLFSIGKFQSPKHGALGPEHGMDLNTHIVVYWPFQVVFSVKGAEMA